MTTERIIRILAGFFVMLSLALGWQGSPVFVSEWFLAFTAFVGFNLFQRVGRGHEDLRQQGVGIKGDGRQQAIQILLREGLGPGR